MRSLGLDVSHVVGVDFHGFSRAVNTLGCVYVDVDRRYFNDNDPPVDSDQPYAAIDLQPGYQRLCGGDALDYVRFRHLDDDFVRAARQQDFLRQAKQQIGLSKAIDERDELLKIFGTTARATSRAPATRRCSACIKLGYEASKVPVREVPVPADAAGPRRVARRRAAARCGVRSPQLEHGGGRRAARRPSAPRSGAAQRRAARRRATGARRRASWRRAPRARTASCRSRRSCGPAGGLLTRRGASRPAATRRATGVRAYAIKHAGGGSHLAYRIVLWQGEAGQYYGVQGTTWRTPPILRNPTDRVQHARAHVPALLRRPAAAR